MISRCQLAVLGCQLWDWGKILGDCTNNIQKIFEISKIKFIFSHE
jgi:hypothetical protein